MAKTYGQMFTEAMACGSPEEGEIWLENYSKELFEEFPEKVLSIEHARKMTLENIGYMTGYYGAEEANHIYKIFRQGHPIFGGFLITER